MCIGILYMKLRMNERTKLLWCSLQIKNYSHFKIHRFQSHQTLYYIKKPSLYQIIHFKSQIPKYYISFKFEYSKFSPPTLIKISILRNIQQKLIHGPQTSLPIYDFTDVTRAYTIDRPDSVTVSHCSTGSFARSVFPIIRDNTGRQLSRFRSIIMHFRKRWLS